MTFLLDGSIVSIPKSIISDNDQYTVSMLQWNFEPFYPQNGINSNLLQIELFTQSGPLPVSGLDSSNMVELTF